MDLSNCIIQKKDTVTIPPLNDPQLQNVAMSLIEAVKSQLSELKLADLYSQQLEGDRRSQFISEFLYHWSGVDSKPPEPLIESSKNSLHTIINEFAEKQKVDPLTLSQIIGPLLPYLTSVSEVENFNNFLARHMGTDPTVPEEEANMIDLATLGSIISEISVNPSETNKEIQQLQGEKLKEIQKAFDECLGPYPEENYLSAKEEFETEALLNR
ncbi:hypothetical protein GPJ56_001802 [Histomonas meleagridis]|uniref:uncharacterized protein n=1 Tax=Histomonas meleagridis TaxID=135588 RepID=UPI0035594387|nr:hypothetical protein GPJ56_001802 [Histomonas meleagridis]KAH0803261.1 hypothetical protein GO595_003997 [Histomonas meleagridis]